MIQVLTDITNATLTTEQIRIITPAPRKTVNAIFIGMRKPDFHSRGIGIDMRYISVDIFKRKLLQRSGGDIVGWQESGKIS